MTKTRTLHLAKNLTLPLDAATETFAILGRRGSGKTHTAVVMAEEMLGAGIPIVVIDPLDVWWGLRVSKDGKQAGLPIYVAGGSHADIPLSADAGKVIADAVVDKGFSIVLSIRHLSKADQRRFVGEFCERLYDRKADPQHRTALHVFIDEADAFVPQRLMPGAERCFGAVDTLVRRGRSSGLAPTLISQRPQVINKDVLSQTEVLVSHQLTGPQDRKALQAWIEANDVDNQGGTFMASLAALQKGEAWFWSPGLLRVFVRVKVRDRHTFDSSATPKAGVTAVASPKAFAPVDLEALTREIAATIEKTKADDPRELRKQIAEQKAEIAKLTKLSICPNCLANSGKSTSVPALTNADRVLLEKVGGQVAEVARQLVSNAAYDVNTLVRDIEQRLQAFQQDLLNELVDVRRAFTDTLERKGLQKVLDKLGTVQSSAKPSSDYSKSITAGSRSIERSNAQPIARPAVAPRVGQSADGVSRAEQRILDSVAWWKAAGIDGPTRHQVAFVAGYTVNGHFNNMVGSLRTKGLVDYPSGGGVALTTAGEAAATYPDVKPTFEGLVDAVRGVLKGDALRRIFNVVVDARDRDLTREQLATLSGYTVNGHFNNMVGALRSLGVVDYPRQGGVRLGAMFQELS